MSKDDITERLVSFIREEFLNGDPKHELDESTPLLEWGILDSLNTTILINAINDELGVDVPMVEISGDNFKTVDGISSLVFSLQASAENR